MRRSRAVDQKLNLTNILIAAILIAAILAMTNPVIMDFMADNTVRVLLSLLRAIDDFCVQYQLMRGVWRDAASSTDPEQQSA